MSRILVIGSSHAAAVRRALPLIAAEYPHHQITCWTLTASCFDMARVGQDGILTPDPTRPGVARQALRWNGADSVDLRLFDHILMCGTDLGAPQSIGLLAGLQPLEWGQRLGARGVSMDFLRAAVRVAIDTALLAQKSRIPFDPRFAAIPVPYASDESHDPAASPLPPAACLARHPQGQALCELYEAELVAACRAEGLTFVPQPRETLARPWVTRGQFIDTNVKDNRHMNDAFGLHIFRAFAASLPDITETSPRLAKAAAT